MPLPWVWCTLFPLPALLLLLARKRSKESRRHVRASSASVSYLFRYVLGGKKLPCSGESKPPRLTRRKRTQASGGLQGCHVSGSGRGGGGRLSHARGGVAATILFAVNMIPGTTVHAFLVMGRSPLTSQLAKHRAAVGPYLKGRVVWITGASSGLGEQLAIRAAEDGVEGLILSGRREDALEKVRRACVAVSPSRSDAAVRVLPFDMGDLDGITTQPAKALGEFGRVDVLVLNAGVSTRGSVEETSMDVDKQVMAVNYLGCVGLVKGVLGPMLNAGLGQFVVINSVQGKFGIPFRASYAASKHALVGFSDTLRAEVANRGVGVTSVFPGYIRTSLSVNAMKGDGTAHARMDPTTASGREPREVANIVWEAVAAGLDEVVVADFKVKIAILLRTLFPRLLFSIMNKRALKEMD